MSTLEFLTANVVSALHVTVLCHLSKQYYLIGLFYPQTVLHRILPSGYHGLFFCMSSVFDLTILVCGLETLSVTSIS